MTLSDSGHYTITNPTLGTSDILALDLDLLSTSTGLDRKDCLERLSSYNFSDMADEWRASAPRTRDEIIRFYSNAEGYLWELLVWNGSSHYDGYRSLIETLAARWPPRQYPKALDFGCGIGTAALHLFRLGYDVTIADVPGRTFNFAQARLQRHGFQPTIIDIRDDILLPPANWDVLVCFDVLEHVVDPDRVSRQLVSGVRRGGGAAIVAAFDTGGPDFPHHLEAGRRRFGGHRWRFHLQRLGLKVVDNSVYRRAGRVETAIARIQYAVWRLTGLYIHRLAR